MDLRYLSGRYTMPFFVGLLLTFVIGGAVGFGIAYLLEWFDGRGSAIIAICAASATTSAVLGYRRSNAAHRLTILHTLTAAYFGSICLIFGGMPGSLIGSAMGGDRGAMIGWFATAPLIAIGGIVWGWRYSHRLEQRPELQVIADHDRRS